MTINQRIKQLRETMKLSQVKFAKPVAISPGHIASIELGNRNVPDRIIKIISFVYGASEEWIKSGEGKMFTTRPSGEKHNTILKLFDELTPENQDSAILQVKALLALQKQESSFDSGEKKRSVA